jgi:hypothetical protein
MCGRRPAGSWRPALISASSRPILPDTYIQHPKAPNQRALYVGKGQRICIRTGLIDAAKALSFSATDPDCVAEKYR